MEGEEKLEEKLRGHSGGVVVSPCNMTGACLDTVGGEEQGRRPWEVDFGGTVTC